MDTWATNMERLEKVSKVIDSMRTIAEIREEAAKIENVPPRNRHERRKAAAMYRRIKP